MLGALLQRMRTVRTVVAGDLVADEYVFGETDRVSREAPVLVVRHESSETRPGGAANVAANVAALGARAVPVGLVGRDEPGREIVLQLEALGADIHNIIVSSTRRTWTKTRILAGGRSTTRQQMLRLDRADDAPLPETHRKLLRRHLRAAAHEADALIVSDYGGGLFDDKTLAAAFAAGTPICADSRYELARFRNAALIKPNEPELEAATGILLRGDDDVERAGRSLMARMEVQAVVVTRGRKGMWLFERDQETLKLPVFGPEEAVDVTGAGDTVLATLACALGAGASFREATVLANIAGGIVVQKPGTATCSHDELAQAVASLRDGDDIVRAGRP